jgi:CRISPR system Cascade subunit CasA
MNLIQDRWIPIRRHDNSRERIAPWQITDQHATNPIVAIDTPRADFTGTLMQFLIGLLQTTTEIDDEEDWEIWFYDLPAPKQLKWQFDPIAYAFELDGDGPRFMQDFDLPEGETKEIAALLIEAPGDKSLRDNLDHFIKRGRVTGLCSACAATALFTLQTNAPSGGVGHRTSLRGGGPLTTLVICDPRRTGDIVGATLWRNTWLNVLERRKFLAFCGNPARTADSDKFPWLAPTRISGKGGRDTTPDDTHPAQMFWGMPRRIQLDFENTEVGNCDICSQASENLITHYFTKNYGVNYVGPWRHPLTPYIIDDQGMPMARHARPGGMSYRHWLGLVQFDEGESRQPARVVTAFQQRHRELKMQLRLWAFGYDMDNMKARCWYEAQMPMYQIGETFRQDFEVTVRQMISAAETTKGYLINALKDAWFEPKDPRRKKDVSFIAQAFWQDTESDFYDRLDELVRMLTEVDDGLAAAVHIKRPWHEVLCRQALRLFDQWAASSVIEYEDPRRIAKAHNQLRRSLYGAKLREKILKLPKQLKTQGARHAATV